MHKVVAMVKNCCVVGFKNYIGKKPGVKFFGFPLSNAERCSKWLDAMYVRLSFLITWPDRETMQQNMPLEFQQLYRNCRVTIDCSEIFIETPSSYKAHSQTYSNYKKINTAKFLIGITPSVTICFLSSCWGGRVSDKNFTQESNI